LGGGQEWGAAERVAWVEARLGVRKHQVSYLPQRRRRRQVRTPVYVNRAQPQCPMMACREVRVWAAGGCGEQPSGQRESRKLAAYLK
jgi:hypothetical protein